MVSRLYRRAFIDPRLENFEHTILRLPHRDDPDQITELALGGRIANGFSGTVYHLRSLEGPAGGLPSGSRWVVKMSNRKRADGRLRGPGRRDRSLRRELALERILAGRIPWLWRQPELEALSASWRRESLPIALTAGMIDSTHGVFLIKPLVEGMTLADIRSQHGHRRIPRRMMAALHDIHRLGQVVHENVQVPADLNRAPQARPFSPDLKPDNLIWVERTDVMQRFGLRRPGFVLVEFDHFGSGEWIYESCSLSLKAYQKLFTDYVRAARRRPTGAAASSRAARSCTRTRSSWSGRPGWSAPSA